MKYHGYKKGLLSKMAKIGCFDADLIHNGYGFNIKTIPTRWNYHAKEFNMPAMQELPQIQPFFTPVWGGTMLRNSPKKYNAL